MGNKIIPKTALISVSDKKGLLPFARSLKKFGVQIVATGGTAKALKKGGIGVKKISTINIPGFLSGAKKRPEFRTSILQDFGKAVKDTSKKNLNKPFF